MEQGRQKNIHKITGNAILQPWNVDNFPEYSEKQP